MPKSCAAHLHMPLHYIPKYQQKTDYAELLKKIACILMHMKGQYIFKLPK